MWQYTQSKQTVSNKKQYTQISVTYQSQCENLYQKYVLCVYKILYKVAFCVILVNCIQLLGHRARSDEIA